MNLFNDPEAFSTGLFKHASPTEIRGGRYPKWARLAYIRLTESMGLDSAKAKEIIIEMEKSRRREKRQIPGTEESNEFDKWLAGWANEGSR